MSNKDFLDSDFNVVMDAISGYNKKETEKYRADWERTRWLATISLQPYSSKGKSIKMQDLAVFAWEKTEKPQERIVSEHQKEWRRRMDELMKRQHGNA